jgi:hypothetical protein
VFDQNSFVHTALIGGDHETEEQEMLKVESIVNP